MAGKNIKVALQITADLNQARLAIQGLNQDLSRITGGMHDLRTSQTTISRSIADTNTGVQRLSSSFNQQNQVVRQLMASTAAYFSVAKLMNEADAYTSLHNKLKLVTEVQDRAAQSQINLKTALGDTFKIAQSAAADWGGVSSIYDKIYKNSERLNISQKQVASITETVTKSISNSGSSAQAASAALYQLGQSFDKGSLNGDEFVSISENAGYVMDVLAKGLGVTRAELRQMSTDGKLTTDAMVTAFINMHDKVNQAYGSTQTTIGGGFTMVSNALKQYIGEADQGIGATNFLVNSLSGVANNFSEIINIMGLAVWGLFTQKLIAQATAMKSQITLSQTNRTALLAEMQATVTATTAEASRTHALMQLTQWKLADARADMARMSGMQRLTFMQQVVLPLERQLTVATAAHTAAQAAQTTATNTLAAAKSRLAIASRAVLGFFGGPLGLVVTGLSVASMYLMMRDSSNEATKSMASQIDTVSELAKQYKQLSFTKLSAEMATIREDMKQAESDVKTALKGVSGVVKSYSGDMQSQKQKAWQEIIDQVKKGDISTDRALLDLSNNEFKFSKGDIAEASKYFEKINDGRAKLDTYNQQLRLGEQLLGNVNGQFDQHNKNIETQVSQINVLESEYSRLNNSFQTHIDYAKENAANNGIVQSSVDEINETLKQYNSGTISATKVAEVFAKSGKVSPDVLRSFVESAQKVDLSKKSLDEANNVFKKTQENAPKTAKVFDEIGSKAASAATEVNLLTKAHKELLESAQNNTFSLQYEIDQRKQGISPELATANAKALSTLNADPNSTQTWFRAPDDVVAANKALLEAQKEQSELNEKDKKAQEAITKQKEQQQKLAITQKAISASTNEQTRNMLMVYQGFMKTNIPDSLARYLTAEVGREGDFLSKNLFGSHNDKNNGETNVGIISYQKTRAKQLLSNLNSKGLLDGNGKIKQTQESIDAQTAFAVNEFLNKREYSTSKNAALSGKSYKQLQQISGHNFIGWDIKANTLSQNLVNKNIARMDGYKNQLDKMLGADPSAFLGDFSKINSIEADFAKVQEQQDQNRISLRESLWTDEEKRKQEHVKKLNDIEKAGFSDVEKAELLAKENQRYEDEISKRPEMLKRVQDSLQSVQQDFLKSSGRGLEADLQAAEDKYKQLKSDIATLMMSETDPVKQKQYQSMLVRLDFVIDKEQLTIRFNDAMQRLEQLQSLRQQKQDTLKLDFESGQISQPQYAEGLKNIDAEMKPQLLGLSDIARDLAERLGDAFNVEKVNNFVAGLNQVDLQFKKFLPTADQLNERIASGLTDSIMDWADGTKSAGDAFRQFASDFLREIAQMILKQMLFNAISQMGGASSGGAGGMIAGALSAAFGGGYATGGYTGSGGKYDPAGIVHKDEFVIRKESTSQQGAKEFLSHFNQYGMNALNKFKGYSSGGLVGAPQVSIPHIPSPKLADPAAMIANSTSFSANQNFYLVDDPARILDVLKSGASQENLVVMMSRDPAKFKSALKL